MKRGILFLKARNIAVSAAIEYLEYLVGKIEEAAETQEVNIDKAADLVVESFLSGGTVFTFGTGHSHLIAEEIYTRAGGLAFIKAILPEEVMLQGKLGKSTLIERLDGYAAVLLELYGVKKGDTIMIISNSGRNSVPVEMAMGAKELGASVIALTSLKHSEQVESRHKSGMRLFEIADVTLDNQAELGDAGFYVDGCETPTGPVSDAIGIALAQAMVVSVVDKLTRGSVEAPILRSANSDGGDAHNAKFEKYLKDLR